MPPRHGKSELCSRFFPAWFLGSFPDKKIILTSYEAEFAKGWGRKARDLLEQYGSWFGIDVDRRSSAAAQWDIRGRAGGMATAGVGGPITGKGADVLLVDDPVKNAEQADSATYRDRAWDWWHSTALSRLEPDGVVIVVQTRWHEDDLAGRILAADAEAGEWLHLDMPAISDGGEALWPERWSFDALCKVRDRLISGGRLRWWEALYQQRPTSPRGGMFETEWFQIIDAGEVPHEAYLDGEAVRYWDKAATEGGGDYSVGTLMLHFKGLFYVLDVKRGQWSTRKREEEILACAQRDRPRFANYKIVVEREPGSAGKDAVDAAFRMLAGFHVKEDRVTGDKVVRAGSWSSAVEARFVFVIQAAWLAAWLEEHRAFPRGAFDDQVDSAGGAYNILADSPHFDLEAWLDAGAF